MTDQNPSRPPRRSRRNSTNTSRAARALSRAEGISYMAARERVLAGEAAPPDAPADSPSDSPADAPADAPAVAAEPGVRRFRLRVSDEIGFSDDVVGLVDLWPEMRAAVAAELSASRWRGEGWELDAIDRVVFADTSGEFRLSGTSSGNPGCDECGSFDAVVRVGSTYLCSTGAVAAGLGEHCDLCGGLVTSVREFHERGCARHPEAEADRERVRRCAGGPDLGDASYPEGVAFCASCGAQFADPEHGIDAG